MFGSVDAVVALFGDCFLLCCLFCLYCVLVVVSLWVWVSVCFYVDVVCWFSLLVVLLWCFGWLWVVALRMLYCVGFIVGLLCCFAVPCWWSYLLLHCVYDYLLCFVATEFLCCCGLICLICWFCYCEWLCVWFIVF